MRKHLRTIIYLFAISIVSSLLWVDHWLEQPITDGRDLLLRFERGDSIRDLITQMQSDQLLDDPMMFRIILRLRGIDTSLRAGEYQLDAEDSISSLIDKMLRGEVKQYPITLIEGWTFKQMMAAIQAHPQIRGADTDVLQHLSLEHPEGWFLPDTYYLDAGTRDIDLLSRSHDAMRAVLEEAWSNRQPDLPLGTPYEALILASIVEKESAVPAERPLIAGVFVNRLRKGMRLQTDPTVIYGLGDKYDGDIRYRDLRTDTPYNTYTRHGLPPTPIAMPGAEAIQAALNPEETEFLFFVALSDGSGRHIFTRTLAEHEKQVDIHQRRK